MYKTDYTIKERWPIGNAMDNKGITGKGTIKIRLYGEVPPMHRKMVRTRIGALFEKDSSNYLRTEEHCGKTEYGFGKSIDSFYAHVKPSRTLLTKL